MTETAEIEALVVARKSKYRREMAFALIACIVMAYLAIFAGWRYLRVTAAAIAALRGLSVALIWLHMAKLSRFGAKNGAKLDEIVDFDATFQARSGFWYAVPLGIGVFMLGLVLYQDTRSPVPLWGGAALGIAVVAWRFRKI